MSTSTATRSRPRSVHVRTATPPQRPTDPAPGSAWPWRRPLVGVLAVAVVGGGTWGLFAPREGSHAHSPESLATVEVPDGTLRVDGLVDKQVGHVMAGMSAAEDVPVGMRRFSVNVTLGATEDEPLRYSSRDFTVSGPGVQPVVPVISQIDSGALQPGTSISGSLSFDVPKEATTLSLTYEGTAEVPLPALPANAEGEHAEHGGADAGAPVKAPAKGPAPAPADHHDAPATPPHEH